MTKTAQIAAFQVENWNLKYPVGTPVTLRLDSGNILMTRTRYPAYLAHSGHAVCFFEGVTGYYLLDRATPIEGRPEVRALNAIVNAREQLRQELQKYWDEVLKPRVDRCTSVDEVRAIMDEVSQQSAGPEGEMRNNPFAVEFLLTMDALTHRKGNIDGN